MADPQIEIITNFAHRPRRPLSKAAGASRHAGRFLIPIPQTCRSIPKPCRASQPEEWTMTRRMALQGHHVHGGAACLLPDRSTYRFLSRKADPPSEGPHPGPSTTRLAPGLRFRCAGRRDRGYRSPLARGYGPAHIAIAGESAGGGLALLRRPRMLRDKRRIARARLAGALALNPRLEMTGATMTSRAAVDRSSRSPTSSKPLPGC